MQIAAEPPGRIAPVEELINTYEIGAMAQRRLDSATYALLAGGDRRVFDRITFRPRLMVNTTGLDLSLDLFGQKHFAPIILGPVSRQKRFHPEGELEMARGAAAAKAAMVISADSSFPLDQIAPLAKAGAWFQMNLGSDMAAVTQASATGCKVLCVTFGAAGADWKFVESLCKSLKIPVVVKGVMSAGEAEAAIASGAQGIIVSNYSEAGVPGQAEALEALPAIADAVHNRIPVLVDGGFRRGSDVLKGLALGAKAVLVARPATWGLSAYGAPGVQRALEILQTDLARDMAMCGKPNLAALDRTVVRMHRW
ncbi:MAG TPA: alpha-hydroxy-acid oxidizing protein [Bryobacteraceae bacterium]|nr:alpha-hydroxy-acid oxidizing protein [Bryobacteraceae bacterium]